MTGPMRTRESDKGSIDLIKMEGGFVHVKCGSSFVPIYSPELKQIIYQCACPEAYNVNP